MRIYKFGGASVRDAASVRNVLSVLQQQEYESLIVVISAMGKTTNKLEAALNSLYHGKHKELQDQIADLIQCHSDIVTELFESPENLHEEIATTFNAIPSMSSTDYDTLYDQIVSLGEIISTKIVSSYVAEQGIPNTWLDAREHIHLTGKHRNGRVDWDKTTEDLREYLTNSNSNIHITQGFIGGGVDGKTYTLGREGSDYTGAILAYCTDAQDLTIWKDVPGMLNADPRHFDNTKKLDNISYTEAIELSYYGASVIHPKTVQPLKRKNIPLNVKSFVDQHASGSIISGDTSSDGFIPCYIVKPYQDLIRIQTKDFSFVAEEHLAQIFGIFDAAGIKINIMQNSAIRFQVSIDHDPIKIDRLKALLEENGFEIDIVTDARLLTVRHYNETILRQLINGSEILVEQRTAETARFVLQG